MTRLLYLPAIEYIPEGDIYSQWHGKRSQMVIKQEMSYKSGHLKCATRAENVDLHEDGGKDVKMRDYQDHPIRNNHSRMTEWRTSQRSTCLTGCNGLTSTPLHPKTIRDRAKMRRLQRQVMAVLSVWVSTLSQLKDSKSDRPSQQRLHVRQ